LLDTIIHNKCDNLETCTGDILQWWSDDTCCETTEPDRLGNDSTAAAFVSVSHNFFHTKI